MDETSAGVQMILLSRPNDHSVRKKGELLYVENVFLADGVDGVVMKFSQE